MHLAQCQLPLAGPFIAPLVGLKTCSHTALSGVSLTPLVYRIKQ